MDATALTPSTSRFGGQLDTDQLIAIERAAGSVVEPAAQLWRNLGLLLDRPLTVRSLDGALRDALARMGELLSAHTVALLLANEDGTELVARAAVGLSEELTIDLGIRSGEGMAGRVLESRRQLVLGDLSTLRVINPVLRDSGLRSVAAVPLLSAGHAFGVLYAASCTLDHFTQRDADLLQIVADRLATGMDRVRLFEREREARRTAQRLAHRAERIQRITAELAGTLTAGDAASVLVRALVSDPPSWRAVWTRDGDHFELAARSGPVPADWEEATLATSANSPLFSAARRRIPEFTQGTVSSAVLPMMSGKRCIGVITIVFDTLHIFSSDERELLVSIVGQAIQAFDRARLSEAQRRAAEHASLFARAAQVLAEAHDLEATLLRLAELGVVSLGEICLIDVVGEDGRVVRMAAKHRCPAYQADVDRLRTEFPPDPGSPHPAIAAIETGHTTWAAHMTPEMLRATTRGEEHLALVESLGFTSYLTVPLVSEARVVGAVTSVSTSRPFQHEDVVFAEQLARHVAAVVDNARRYESAFRTSQILQSSLLPPRLPAVAGVRVDTRYLTANRGLEVGGDFFDVLALATGHVLFTIGDVAGHDRRAAAQMGHLRSALRAFATMAGSPTDVISSLRASWDLLGFERMATVLVGSIDPRSRELAIASAGHYPPLRVRPDGATYVALEPSPPLGVDGAPALEWHGILGREEVLLGYTDGAIDERAAGIDVSMDRLARAASDGAVHPEAVCDRVVARLAADRSDDVALVALALT